MKDVMMPEFQDSLRRMEFRDAASIRKRKLHMRRSPTVIKERLCIKARRTLREHEALYDSCRTWTRNMSERRETAERQLTALTQEYGDLLSHCAPQWKMGKEALNDLWHEVDLMGEKISKAHQHHDANMGKPSVLPDRASWAQPINFMQVPFVRPAFGKPTFLE